MMHCSKIILGTVLLLFSLEGGAQYEDIWIFGRGQNEGAGLDFTNGDPVPISTNMGGWGEAAASVCDVSGNLLFYTNGDEVWDQNHNIMPNGHELTGLPENYNGYSPCSSTTQGTIIVPMPGSSLKYYVFSLSAQESDTLKGRLYYSIVDMALNDGLGDLEPGSKGILLDSMLSEKMTAVSGDHCNIWLMVHKQYPSNVFHTWEIFLDGISTMPVISSIGNFNNYDVGMLVFSPDRSKMLASNAMAAHGGLELFDFDVASGEVSNPVLLDANQLNMYYGAAFSPDNTKVYATSSYKLFQFDLNAADPVTSKILLGNCASAALKLGPDSKIYTPARTGEMPSLSLIQFPNLPGLSCGYIEEAISLLPETVSWIGLPNIIPVIPYDTFFSHQEATAGCFATHMMIEVQNSTGWDYLWNTGSTETSNIVDAPGTYWVNYRTPPCNFHVDTFQVGFPNGVLPTIYIDTACVNASNGGAYAATYPGDTVHYDYIWLSGTDTLSVTDTLSSVPSGHYTLLVHTVDCDTSLNFMIPQVDYRVSFTAADTLLCMGDILQVQNTSDTHFDGFVWYFGDGDSSLAATPPGHPYVHPGGYEILLTGSGSICKDTTRKSVIVDSSFSIAFQMDQPEICVGDDIAFQLAEADSTFTGLHWDWGDGSYMTAAYESRFYHAFDQPGVWLVQVTLNARVCPDTSFTDTVRVYTLPEVNLGGETSLCMDGHAVVLRNLADEPGEAYHYLWSTGDTTAGLRVLQPGAYSLRITTEPLGCNSTDEIEVTKDCYTDIPNAFTPNGDGDNDYFFPRTQLSQSISSFKMQVLNRWGQLVFETTSIDGRGWDGRFNDKEQPLGVYIYVMEVVYANGRQEQYKGNVTLVR